VFFKSRLWSAALLRNTFEMTLKSTMFTKEIRRSDTFVRYFIDFTSLDIWDGGSISDCISILATHIIKIHNHYLVSICRV